MSAGISRNRSKVRQLVYSKSPLRVVIESGPLLDEGNACLAKLKLFTREFLTSTEMRSVCICTTTGLPIEKPVETQKEGESKSVNRLAVEVFVNQPILSFNQIVGDNGNFRFVTIGCSGRTHYVVIRGNVSFTFFAPETSITPKEAVHVLLSNNFLEGPRLYEKTAIIVQDFFYLIMTAVYPERDIFHTTIKTINGLAFTCRVYFDPAEPRNTGISIGGYMYHFNMNAYPKPQLNRAIRKLTKSEVEERISAPQSISFMTKQQKAEVEEWARTFEPSI